MRYYTCFCGNLECWGSDPPSPCSKCEKCGTRPGGGEPKEHDWDPYKVETDEGDKTLTRCRWCMCRKPPA